MKGLELVRGWGQRVGWCLRTQGKSWERRSRRDGAGREGADPCKGEWCHEKEEGTPKLAQEIVLQVL